MVYRCTHCELGSEVAIKEYFPAEFAVRESGSVYPRGTSNNAHFEDGLRRFIKEGRQLEAFRDSPTIVTCRDLFPANGTAYMVMDLVPGMPLSELLSRRESNGQPFTEKDLLSVMQPLLEGLSTVHAAGVYHRDIKPSNVLIRHDNGRPVLIDFGAAKQTATGLTKSIAPYTEGYAAPEQVGEGRIGPWTDVYGVGAVAWRVIAGGSPPWSPPNPVSVQRRLYSQLQGKGDSMPAAAELGKGRFTTLLLQAVDECLIMSEGNRTQSSEELLGRIRRASATPQVPFKVSARRSASGQDAPPRSPAQHQLEKRRKRTSAKFTLVLAAIVCVPVIGFALSSVFQNNSPSPGSGTRASNESVLSATQPATRHAALTVVGVEGTPSNARFVISDGSRTYPNGAQLAPGYYLIRASAPGYQDYERVVAHGEDATRTLARLRQIPMASENESADAESTTESAGSEAGLAHEEYVTQESAESETGATERSLSETPTDRQVSRSIPDWPYVARESSESRVREVLGNPDRITRGTGIETWHYGSSLVTIDSQTRRVRSWYDSGDNSPASTTGNVTGGRQISAAEGATFTTGSHESEVRRVQGSPERLARRADYTEWYYGQSVVLIDAQTRQVRSWNNAGGNLKVSTSDAARSEKEAGFSNSPLRAANTIGVGSYATEVRRVLGVPDEIARRSKYEAWYFGRSIVFIDSQTQKVSDWTIAGKELEETPSGIVRGERKTSPSECAPSFAVVFRLGSDECLVREVQGAPDRIVHRENHEAWYYGRSVVSINDRSRRVVAWRNTDGNLKMSSSSTSGGSKAASTFTRGSPADEVLRLQGKPDEVRRYTSGYEVWAYGNSTVRIDTRTQRVQSWSNLDRNLKVD